MPSRTPKQRKVMSAIAHGWRPKGSAAGIPKKVAEEFHDKDRGKYGHLTRSGKPKSRSR